MRRLPAHNTPARLLSTAGTWGEIQLVPTGESVTLDVQTRTYDTAGQLQRDHALANLPLPTARRLRDMLSEALAAAAAADPYRAGLWSDATLAHSAREPGRHR